ncbi:MAG: hypothetical protein IPO83_03330 [Chitinophagaceae bacterium]|nr:hypothetical protein [Chitinophagaceae bacterium]
MLHTLVLGLNGIQISSGSSPTGVTYTSTISDNTVNITSTGIALMTGIDFGHGISTGTIVGSNNSVTVNQTASASVSAAIIGIKANYSAASNTANANAVIINQSNSAGATTSAVTGIIALALVQISMLQIAQILQLSNPSLVAVLLVQVQLPLCNRNHFWYIHCNR